MDKRTLKAVVFAVSLAPLLWVVGLGVSGNLSRNPIEDVLNRLGFYALTFLTLSLAPTPLKILFDLKRPLLVRRMLGLFAFFYASLHFITYAVIDQGLDVGEIWKDVVKRPFITVGFSALVLMIPMAVTSTERMVQRLGFTTWKRIHRTVYVAAILGVVHFFWRTKADDLEPGIFALIIAFQLAVRVIDAARRR